MIQVVVYQKESGITKISVSGHAYYNEPGKDLVCASVSSIMTGLLNSFVELGIQGYNYVLQDNPAFIEVETKSPTERGNTILHVGLIQLRTIHEVYPQYIQINYRR